MDDKLREAALAAFRRSAMQSAQKRADAAETEPQAEDTKSSPTAVAAAVPEPSAATQPRPAGSGGAVSAPTGENENDGVSALQAPVAGEEAILKEAVDTASGFTSGAAAKTRSATLSAARQRALTVAATRGRAAPVRKSTLASAEKAPASAEEPPKDAAGAETTVQGKSGKAARGPAEARPVKAAGTSTGAAGNGGKGSMAAVLVANALILLVLLLLWGELQQAHDERVQQQKFLDQLAADVSRIDTFARYKFGVISDARGKLTGVIVKYDKNGAIEEKKIAPLPLDE